MEWKTSTKQSYKLLLNSSIKICPNMFHQPNLFKDYPTKPSIKSVNYAAVAVQWSINSFAAGIFSWPLGSKISWLATIGRNTSIKSCEYGGETISRTSTAKYLKNRDIFKRTVKIQTIIQSLLKNVIVKLSGLT